MNVVIQAVGVVYGSCKASPLPERHADAAVSECGGEAVGIVYFAYARVAVAGGKGFVKEHHARRAVKHEVASVNDIDGTRSRRQARVKVMILLVAIQLVHLKRHGKHRGESLRSGVVGQCGVERCAVHCYFDVTFHIVFVIVAAVYTAVGTAVADKAAACVAIHGVVFRAGG